ncbi:MAG TPA: ATP-binding protein [Candidatus Saccharimonadales bacterium]|nr:ATP-binding protein [Candidatus Saccharimonadales bacterium]
MLDDKTTPSIAASTAELEHERLRSLINSMADGVIAIDEQANVVLYNGAALNILDVNSTITAKPIHAVLKLVDKNNQPIDVTKIILETKISTASRNWRLIYPDGENISLYISIAPVRLGYGQAGMRGYVILLRDITREKSLEEERDEFISVVSHELRTPIAIAEGNVGNAQFILEKSGDLNAVKASLKETYNQIIFLAGMINDLSTLSRAERGKLAVEVESINVAELIEELLKNYAPDAQKKGLELKSDIDPSLEVLQSSRLYVREVLQNFITNAIKYTEAGHVVIGAKPKGKGVVFYVSDTGIGISKSDKDKVFDKFFRSEDFRTRKNKGTGLGLYVTMKLVRLLHAEINLESEINKGTTFTVFIPNLEQSAPNKNLA